MDTLPWRSIPLNRAFLFGCWSTYQRFLRWSGNVHTAEKTNIAQQTKETTKNQDNADYQLSDRERNKLSGKEAEQKAEKTTNSEMPEYIAKMIEQLKELKQLLEELVHCGILHKIWEKT